MRATCSHAPQNWEGNRGADYADTMPLVRLRVLASALACAVTATLTVGAVTMHTSASTLRVQPQTPALNASSAPKAGLVIDAVVPAIPTLTSGIKLSGRVVSASAPCSVNLAIVRTALTSRSALAALTTSGSAARRRVNSAESIGHTESDSATGQWQLQVNASALKLTSRTPAGVYPLLVSATCGGHTAYTATVAPWLPSRASVKPSSLAMLWPVALSNPRNLDNTWDDNALQTSLQTFGSLRSLLNAGRAAAVSWLIDPEALDTLALAAGRPDSHGQVRSRLNSNTKALAQTWLEDFANVASSAPVLALPRGLPSAATAARGNRLVWVQRAQASAAADTNRVLGVTNTVPGVVAWPCAHETRCLSRQDLVALTSGPHAPLLTVLPDSIAPPKGTPNWTTGAVARLPQSQSRLAVVTDSGLDRLLADGDGITEPALLRQRLISEFALISLERPNQPRTIATTIALGLPTQAALTGAVAGAEALSLAQSAGFIASRQLSDVLKRTPEFSSRIFRLQRPLKVDSLMASTIRARAAATSASSLLSDDGDRATWRRQASTTAANAISLTWQGNRTGQNTFVDLFAKQASARRAGVRVVTAKRVYLGRSNGTIPFTVINTLDVPVTVFPQVTGYPFTRISLGSTPEQLTLAPGERQGVPVGARILGSGAITVSFLVRGADNHLISTPASTMVMTSAYARIATWVVGIAFALLLVLIVNNIRRQIRRRRFGGQSDGHSAVMDVEP